MENQNQLAIQNNTIGVVYSSVQANTPEEKVALFNATQSPDRIKNYINNVIIVKDIILENVEFLDTETGEVKILPRTILISPDGSAYTATSVGIFNGIKNLVSIFGLPETWEQPIKIMVKQKSIGLNNILTFDLV